MENNSILNTNIVQKLLEYKKQTQALNVLNKCQEMNLLSSNILDSIICGEFDIIEEHDIFKAIETLENSNDGTTYCCVYMSLYAEDETIVGSRFSYVIIFDKDKKYNQSWFPLYFDNGYRLPAINSINIINKNNLSQKGVANCFIVKHKQKINLNLDTLKNFVTSRRVNVIIVQP